MFNALILYKNEYLQELIYEDLDYLIQLPLNLGLIIDIEAREDKNILMNVLNKGF